MRRRRFNRVHQAHALEAHAFGEAGEEARGRGGVEHDEDALVVGAADQPAEGLGDAGAGCGVVIGLAAEAAAPSLVQQVGTRQGHLMPTPGSNPRQMRPTL
jgi:hypothetical protein